MIPVKYNIRKPPRSPDTTLMTVIGTGMVVWAMVLTLAYRGAGARACGSAGTRWS